MLSYLQMFYVLEAYIQYLIAKYLLSALKLDIRSDCIRLQYHGALCVLESGFIEG